MVVVTSAATTYSIGRLNGGTMERCLTGSVVWMCSKKASWAASGSGGEVELRWWRRSVVAGRRKEAEGNGRGGKWLRG